MFSNSCKSPFMSSIYFFSLLFFFPKSRSHNTFFAPDILYPLLYNNSFIFFTINISLGEYNLCPALFFNGCKNGNSFSQYLRIYGFTPVSSDTSPIVRKPILLFFISKFVLFPAYQSFYI